MAKKATKALAKQPAKKLLKQKAVWGGAQQLMNKPATDAEGRSRQLILLASRALRVSPFGVNILGDVPYINKLGLMQKAKDYKPAVSFLYNWIRYAEDDNAKAICACKVVEGKRELSDWVIGECSPSSMKMSTLKGYQNHMAQTRARNRAILEVFGYKIHEDMMENIKRLTEAGAMTERQARLMEGAAASTAEEVNVDVVQIRTEKAKTSVEVSKLLEYAVKCGAKPGQEKAYIEKVIGESVDLENLSGRDAIRIKTQLMAKGSK